MRETTTDLTQFLENFQENREQVAFAQGDKTYVWGEVLDRISRVTQGLLAQGLAPQETLLVSLPPSPELFISLLAINSVGARALTLPTTQPRDAFLRWADAAQVVGAILSEDVIKRIHTDLTSREGFRFGFTTSPQPLETWQPFGALEAHAQKASSSPQNPDQDAIITLSAGTFAPPHALIFSQRNLLASAKAFAHKLQQSEGAHAQGLNFLPWGITMLSTSLGILEQGGTVILPTDFDPGSFWTAASTHKADFYLSTPYWNQQLHPSLQESQHPMQFGLLFGDEAPPSDTIPQHSVYSIEACAGPIAWSFENTKHHGPLLDGFEVKRHERDTAPHPKGREGEGPLYLRGPMISASSLDAEGNKHPLLDEHGWYFTRDHGHIDKSGNVTLQGRQERQIQLKKGTFPAKKLETLLNAHPQIQASIFYRMNTPPHALKACIQPDPHAPGRPLTTRVVLDYLREHVPHFQLPKFVEFREELPRNIYGQIAHWQLN